MSLLHYFGVTVSLFKLPPYQVFMISELIFFLTKWVSYATLKLVTCVTKAESRVEFYSSPWISKGADNYKDTVQCAVMFYSLGFR